MTRETKRGTTGQVVAGLVVLLVGLALFFDELGSVRFGDIGQLWPLIVIAVGASRLMKAETAKDRRGGWVVLFVGVWLLISSLALFGLDFQYSWPLVLVAVGLGNVIGGTGAGEWVKGAFLILLGGWMLAVVLHYQGLSWQNSWPLMLVGGGLYIVVTAFLPRAARQRGFYGLKEGLDDEG